MGVTIQHLSYVCLYIYEMGVTGIGRCFGATLVAREKAYWHQTCRDCVNGKGTKVKILDAHQRIHMHEFGNKRINATFPFPLRNIAHPIAPRSLEVTCGDLQLWDDCTISDIFHTKRSLAFCPILRLHAVCLCCGKRAVGWTVSSVLCTSKIFAI